MKQLFTSESVTEGHPDKMADQISDAILDAYLTKDPYSHVAIECLLSDNYVTVAGEVSSNAVVDMEKVTRNKIVAIGYDSPEKCFDGNTCHISIGVNEQSQDVGDAVVTGAGDQGLMFGYACNDTAELMPLPAAMANRLAEKLTSARRHSLPYLYPDGKTQVTVEYDDNGKPSELDTVVISSHHAVNKSVDYDDILKCVVEPVVAEYGMTGDDYRLIVNPGSFNVGGPKGDTGLTGRKIIADTYGGMARHGGGAFSGKDATKVDRSAAYALRWIAKNVVAAGLADVCEIQASYVLAYPLPIGMHIDCFGTNLYPLDMISNSIARTFDLSVNGIITALDLRRPTYSTVSAYGHFGRSWPTWEQTNKVDDLWSNL